MAIESTSTIYTIRDLLNWQRDGTLDLRPPFQRNAIWRPIARSSLIDSLLRGFPIPALFLQDRTDSRSFERRLIVVDGQQRLRTILGFVDISVLKDADDRDRFVIMKIHDKDRAGKGFSDLSDEDRDRILSTRLNVSIVGSSVTEAELLEIFRRMNTYGAHLNAQELRNANFDGFFKEVAYRLATDALDAWLTWGLFSRQDIAEMRDAEFVSDLMLLLMNGTQSATKKYLDDAYRDNNDDFPNMSVCTERFHTLMPKVDDVLRIGPPVRRVVTKMWVYSLFDALQRRVYAGPIVQTGEARPKRISAKAIREACIEVNRRIEDGSLPDEVEKATLGAATDKANREARAAFLLELLGGK